MKLMMMKPMNLKLAAFVAATAVCAAVQAGPRPPVVDSTGFRAGVVGAALPVPAPGLTVNDVKNITTAIVSNTTNTNIPPGYREVQVPMGPHSLGGGGGTYGLSYYQGLGYAVVPAAPLAVQFYAINQVDPPSGSACGDNLTSPRVVAIAGTPIPRGDGSSSPVPPTLYHVCEPAGTRYSLEKVIGATVLNVTRSMLDMKTIFPAIGVSTQAAGAYCQSVGYVNYVPGSAATTQGPGGCDDTRITRWNGSAFYNDIACYNNVLQSMQCFK